jgi:hypothetical protein
MNIEHATSNGEWVHGSPFQHGKKIVFTFTITHLKIVLLMVASGGQLLKSWANRYEFNLF